MVAGWFNSVVLLAFTRQASPHQQLVLPLREAIFCGGFDFAAQCHDHEAFHSADFSVDRARTRHGYPPASRLAEQSRGKERVILIQTGH